MYFEDGSVEQACAAARVAAHPRPWPVRREGRQSSRHSHLIHAGISPEQRVVSPAVANQAGAMWRCGGGTCNTSPIFPGRPTIVRRSSNCILAADLSWQMGVQPRFVAGVCRFAGRHSGCGVCNVGWCWVLRVRAQYFANQRRIAYDLQE